MSYLKKTLVLISTLFFTANVFAAREKGNWEGAWEIEDVCYVEHTPTYVLVECYNSGFRVGVCADIDRVILGGGVLVENLHLCTNSTEKQFLKALKRAKFHVSG